MTGLGRTTLAALAGLVVASAGCGDDPERQSAARTAQPSPTATSTPPPAKKLPKLNGLKFSRTGAQVDRRAEVERFVKKEAGRVLRRTGASAPLEEVGCDRVIEETLVITCYLLAEDGYFDYVITWATEAERRLIGFKAHSALTCGERAQQLEKVQASALARLIRYRTGVRPRPSKRKLERDVRREIDRRCAAGSKSSTPGEAAVNAVGKRIG